MGMSDPLGDLFGGGPIAQPAATSQPMADPLGDIFGGGMAQPQVQAQP